MQQTIDFTLKLFVENLDRQVKKYKENVKNSMKAPKSAQHVMVSKNALDTLLLGLSEKNIQYTYNNCVYNYEILNEYCGFKTWKVWIERID